MCVYIYVPVFYAMFSSPSEKCVVCVCARLFLRVLACACVCMCVNAGLFLIIMHSIVLHCYDAMEFMQYYILNKKTIVWILFIALCLFLKFAS